MNYAKLLTRHNVSVQGTRINQSSGEWVRYDEIQSLLCGLENDMRKLKRVKFISSVSGLSYEDEHAAGDISAVIIDNTRYQVINTTIDALLSSIESTSNLLRGMSLDERIPYFARDVMVSRVIELDAIFETEDEYVCPYCGTFLPNQQTPCCGEIGHGIMRIK